MQNGLRNLYILPNWRHIFLFGLTHKIIVISKFWKCFNCWHVVLKTQTAKSCCLLYTWQSCFIFSTIENQFSVCLTSYLQQTRALWVGSVDFAQLCTQSWNKSFTKPVNIYALCLGKISRVLSNVEFQKISIPLWMVLFLWPLPIWNFRSRGYFPPWIFGFLKGFFLVPYTMYYQNVVAFEA